MPLLVTLSHAFVPCDATVAWTAPSIVILALGIGANIAIFAVADPVTVRFFRWRCSSTKSLKQLVVG
jgi:hypothetical protein